MKKRPEVYLTQMLFHASGALTYVTNHPVEVFLANQWDQYALSMAVLQLGESANQLTQPFQDQHPEVPWLRIIGIRHLLAHAYEEAEMELIYDYAREVLPPLVALIESLGITLTPPDD